MAKWADYRIYRQRMSEGQIMSLPCVIDDGGLPLKRNQREFMKEAVIERIEKGSTFVTMFYKSGEWTRGANVRVQKAANGKKHLRTDPNNIDADNLGNLPKI